MEGCAVTIAQPTYPGGGGFGDGYSGLTLAALTEVEVEVEVEGVAAKAVALKTSVKHTAKPILTRRLIFINKSPLKFLKILSAFVESYGPRLYLNNRS